MSFVKKHSQQSRRVLAALGLTLLAVGCSGNGPPSNTMPDPMNPMSYRAAHTLQACSAIETNARAADCEQAR